MGLQWFQVGSRVTIGVGRDSGLEPSQNSGVEYAVVQDWDLGLEAAVVAVGSQPCQCYDRSIQLLMLW